MKPTPCPSCRQVMAKHRFARNLHGEVVLDLCFPCQGIWFDGFESAQLTPGGIIELFKLIHAHRDGQRLPGSGSCTEERVLNPVGAGDRPAMVCATFNTEDRIWKGRETRVVRLKYLGGTFGDVPPAASLTPGVFLQGLAQTTNLSTKLARVRYGL